MTHLVNSAISFIIFIFVIAVVVVLVYAFNRMCKIADRYRLKYGFDRDIESKHSNDVDRVERLFKRRTFKD